MCSLTNYDFTELVGIIKSLGNGEIEIDPINSRTILGTQDIISAVAILNILCELKVINDFVIGEDWSLSILKE